MILNIWVKNLIRTNKNKLKQKGFYPYEYMNDFEKFEEKKSLVVR